MYFIKIKTVLSNAANRQRNFKYFTTNKNVWHFSMYQNKLDSINKNRIKF